MAEKSKVLITGGAGFLGSHLADRFLAEGYSVIVMDNLITGNLENIEHLFGHEDFLFLQHDVTNFVWVKRRTGLHYAFCFSCQSDGLFESAYQDVESRCDGYAQGTWLGQT